MPRYNALDKKYSNHARLGVLDDAFVASNDGSKLHTHLLDLKLSTTCQSTIADECFTNLGFEVF